MYYCGSVTTDAGGYVRVYSDGAGLVNLAFRFEAIPAGGYSDLDVIAPRYGIFTPADYAAVRRLVKKADRERASSPAWLAGSNADRFSVRAGRLARPGSHAENFPGNLVLAWLDWTNNYLSLEKFAADYGISEAEAEIVIASGREINNIAAQTAAALGWKLNGGVDA